MYNNYFNSISNNLYEKIKNINSSYQIKNYLHQEFVDHLNSITDDECDLLNKKLIKNKSAINELLKLNNNISIDELENIMGTNLQCIEDLIDCSKIYESMNDKHKINILKSIYSNMFMPLRIIQWIEESATELSIITFNNITIYLISDIKTDNLVTHIVTIVKWLLMISNKNNKKLDLYLFLSDIIKEIPHKCNKKECSLKRENINSGTSYNNNWIHIYRKEELFKVLIHELIHYLEIDINNYAYIIDGLCSHILMHKASKPILVNEAYTEFLAIYLHTLYISKNISHYSKKSLEEIFFELLLNEEKFTLYQINKIFKISGLEDISYFRKSNDFIQYTNVISYFILKYIFLINSKYFIKTYKTKKITLKLTEKIIKGFFKLKIPKIDVLNNDTSLRMSLYELK